MYVRTGLYNIFICKDCIQNKKYNNFWNRLFYDLLS